MTRKRASPRRWRAAGRRTIRSRCSASWSSPTTAPTGRPPSPRMRAARVVERFDAEKKSKGYALEYLIGRLVESGEFDALDALVVVDADTTIDPDLLRRFDDGPAGGPRLDPVLLHGGQPRPELADPPDDLCVQPVQRRHAAGPGCHGSGWGPARQRDVLLDPRAAAPAMGVVWAGRGHGILLAAPARRGADRVRTLGPRPWGDAGLGGAAAAAQRRRWEFGRREIRRKYWLRSCLRSDRLGWWEKLVSLCEITLPYDGGLLLVLPGAS